MTNTIAEYRGKPLDSYSKGDLIQIINDLANQQQFMQEQNAKDRERLIDMFGRKRRRILGIIPV